MIATLTPALLALLAGGPLLDQPPAIALRAVAQGVSMESAKRRPPTVAPLTIGDVTISVDYAGRQYGVEQSAGVVTATDKAGTHLWTKIVYPIVYAEAGEEEDAQDVFITTLAPGPDDASIIVTNEDGQRFSVTLSDGTATELK